MEQEILEQIQSLRHTMSINQLILIIIISINAIIIQIAIANRNRKD